MKTLRLGVVGCGDIAGYTALVSRLIPQVRLVACCDVDADRLQEFARRHKITQAHNDFTEMLAAAELDALYLAVPHNLHFEMAELAIRRGLPILVEKPLARTLEEGLALTRQADQAGVKVGVNYQYRYDTGCYALARAVQAGALGQVRSARINVPWLRESSYFERAAWHETMAQAGGGTLITQGSHFLDVVLWALKDKPLSAMGYTARPGFEVEVETLAHGIVELVSGALVSITSTMVAAWEGAVTIEVYGEQGIAWYSNRPWPHVKFMGVRARRERPPVWGVHALQRGLAGFACWVLDDLPYLTPAAEALPVLAAVQAIYASANSGRREIVQLK
ncbi:MAG TPA: Gfo/Idh/MocA family oxidoreductase [Anaerolineales bacterium]|nr:Gfo/Idh/MocA family oxidoreductase [Anaerolineales bacterium]